VTWIKERKFQWNILFFAEALLVTRKFRGNNKRKIMGRENGGREGGRQGGEGEEGI